MKYKYLVNRGVKSISMQRLGFLNAIASAVPKKMINYSKCNSY